MISRWDFFLFVVKSFSRFFWRHQTWTIKHTTEGKKHAIMSSLPSDTLPANHRNATNVLLNTLAELETIFAPLFATPSSLSETLAKLDIEKRCQLELMIGYAINTLAFSKFFFCFFLPHEMEMRLFAKTTLLQSDTPKTNVQSGLTMYMYFLSLL